MKIADGNVSSYQELERVDRISSKNGYSVAELALYSNSTHWVETEYLLHEADGVFGVGYKNEVEGEVFYSEPDPSPINSFTPGVQSAPQTLPAPESGFSTLSVVSTAYIDYSAVTVPAGSFPVTVRFDETATGSYLGYSFTIESKAWYAKDVGEIKHTSTVTFDDPQIGQLGYGSRTLRSYSIP
ncbi:hypothetical protein [Tichowtungia aerotolerans]|uniref:Uncharacterized protein n=1 Tax=Tichowtungia aerotolerans TaxID=2697043 RepID=A0A6P1M4I7_9BACT|nr:hypothetical protein [Tichowtungia aerotolerans]QHI69510.1 hypothetical protein GT409_08595 [Tichowtungia aerotolerans]